MYGGAIGSIIGAVIAGLIVGIGIDAEEAKIAGVPWPYPVIGISSKLSDRFGRGSNKAHIAKSHRHNGQVLKPVEKCLDLYIFMRLQRDVVSS